MPQRALPQTEDDIREMLSGGLLAERHYFDIKRELGAGQKANKGLAVDLASFAVDGGAVLFGVADDEPGDPLVPFAFEGLKERIDQVAHSRVDGPLYVRVIEIPSAEDPNCGYVLVIVPPSPEAPHMVDGKYRGRGDTTNIILSDSEVKRLHALRIERERNIHDLIQQEVARDPSPEDLRTQAHLFVIAAPVSGHPELLHRAVQGAGWHEWLGASILQGPPCQGGGLTWSPDLYSGFTAIARRAEGYAIHSLDLDKGRQVRPNASEDSLIELEFGEDGFLRLFCGRASAEEMSYGRVVFEELVTGLAKRVVLAAKVVADTASYYGAWDFGVAVTNVRGARSYFLAQRGVNAPYSGEDYEQALRASYERLSEDPSGIVDALVGRFNRALSRDMPADSLPF